MPRYAFYLGITLVAVGAWTVTPNKWSNDYFTNLLEYDWQLKKGPGGHFQWRPAKKAGAKPGPVDPIFMLTADVALLKDTKYLKLVCTVTNGQLV